MFSVIFNKDFPYEKLRKSIKIAFGVLILQAVFFWINVIFNSGFIVWTNAALHVLIVISLFGTGAYKISKGHYDKEFYSDLQDFCEWATIHHASALFLGLLGFFVESVSEVAHSFPISLCIFYGLNFVGIATCVTVWIFATDVLDAINEAGKFKKGADVECEVQELESEYEGVYSGLNDVEIDTIKPTLSKIYSIWERSFNEDDELIRPDTFWETLDFLNNSFELIDAYKKSKIETNLDFLESFNKAAEEFYQAIYPKEQVARREELKTVMEIFKVKSQKTLKERQK